GDPERQQHAELPVSIAQREVKQLMTHHAMAHRANQAYRGSAVSVPPLKGVIMLLNGAITCLRKSLLAQEARRFEEGFEDLTRAQPPSRLRARRRARGRALQDLQSADPGLPALLRPAAGRPALSPHHCQPRGASRGLGVRRGNRGESGKGGLERISGAASIAA